MNENDISNYITDPTTKEAYDECFSKHIRFYRVTRSGAPGNYWEWHDIEDGEVMSDGLWPDPADCIKDAYRYLLTVIN